MSTSTHTHTHKHGVGWKEHSADIISDTFLHAESDMGTLTKDRLPLSTLSSSLQALPAMVEI